MATSDMSASLFDEGCLWLALYPEALARQGCSSLKSAAIGMLRVGAFCAPCGARGLSCCVLCKTGPASCRQGELEGQSGCMGCCRYMQVFVFRTFRQKDFWPAVSMFLWCHLQDHLQRTLQPGLPEHATECCSLLRNACYATCRTTCRDSVASHGCPITFILSATSSCLMLRCHLQRPSARDSAARPAADGAFS